jgi:saccharopine dehydrogenase-like NADP-dependent oxidoreductase
VALGKHLITASYISPDVQALHQQAVHNNVMLMCELGLDPGIDHMSAMQLFDSIEQKQGKIISFKSHCGGLVAPQSDNNPWHYKISWNPRNVVTAGAAGAHYLLDNNTTHISYEQLFATEALVNIPQIGKLAYYPNRDSLGYKALYALEHTHTLVRTTLRYPEYINAWHYIILMGATKTTDTVVANTYNDWCAQLLQGVSLQQWYATHNVPLQAQLLINSLQLDSPHPIKGKAISSADVLQSILENKWQMQAHDKDMIVMQHEIEYTIDASKHNITSSLVVIGDDNIYTAMAKTVGLPMAILCKHLLLGTIKAVPGVQLPILPAIYNTIMDELQLYGITFTEHEN